MALILRCDRCGTEENAVLSDPDTDLSVQVVYPHGWEKVVGATLCNNCSRALHEWISTKVARAGFEEK